MSKIENHKQYVANREALAQLLAALTAAGYRIVGPTVRDAAIIYDEIHSIADLPEGWTDEQDGGHYRIKKRNDHALFGYAVGPQSWKKYLYPPSLRLWQARRENGNLHFNETSNGIDKIALLGVRPCELHAISILDKVLLQGPYKDLDYESRRNNAFIIAVNCSDPAGTCFCVSTQTGPQSRSGYDVALTEIISEKRHDFVIDIGTEAGARLLSEIPVREASDEDRIELQALISRTETRMGRHLNMQNIKQLLYSNYDNKHWDQIANRCLNCANCTMVCPTCFCTTVEDVTSLNGETAERRRRWDSCFTLDFSYIHGGPVRTSPKSRYRQWLTHKFAAWQDQFGTSGCVGCGRCITWCPVGIDLTKEIQAIRQKDTIHETLREEQRL